MNNKIMTKGERLLSIINGALLLVLSVITLYPLWFILISSVSDPILFDQSATNQVFILFPQGFTLEYILEHVANNDIWHAYTNTLIYTFGGTFISMVLTILAAYVISRKFKGVVILNVLVILTIWLKPGMIATYLNIEGLNLLGSRWGILIPFAFSGFNVILLKTGFQSIHKDIIEAAEIDGANHLKTLWHIVLPNSVPILTTVTLFYAIEKWNGYFWAEVVLQDYKLYPLQVMVKKILQAGGDSTQLFEGVVSAYALIVIAVLPMILVFPFIQRFFKKGVMDGSIK